MKTVAPLMLLVMFSACGDDEAIGRIGAVDSVSLDGLLVSDTSTSIEVTSTSIEDTSIEDTSIEDTGIEDTSIEDTSTSTEDTSTEDTSIEDTSIEDTSIEDTSIEDTSTSTEDTSTEDTTTPPEDTTVADTAIDAPDTLGPEPLPPADPSQLSAPPYLMWVTSSEVSVRWETKTPVIGRVDFGPTDALGSSVVEPSARTTHELRLTGLPPANLNSYRVVYGGGALPVRTFRTAPLDDAATTDPIRFIVWGDNQNGPSTFGSLTQRMADLDPDFALNVGDCVQNGTRAEYRSQLFAPLEGFADEVPFLVAAGNHERYGDSNAALFGEYFSQPGDEHCFGWRYGELFVLFIDTDLELDGDGGQRGCIEAALTSPAALGATVQAAAFHKPPRVEWWFGGYLAFTDEMEAPWVREDLEPLLQSHGVDLVFNGHNHLYAHTPASSDITWVTTGGGGGMLDTKGLFNVWRVGNWDAIETTLHEFHFLLVEVHAGEVHVEAIDLDGDVIHDFFVYGD